MKMITQEILKDKYEEIKQAYLNCDQSHIYAESRVIATIEELMHELREIDQLTVTKLRPMSKADIGDYAIIFLDSGITGFGYKVSNDCDVFIEGRGHFENALGWLPMPIYNPDDVDFPDHD